MRRALIALATTSIVAILPASASAAPTFGSATDISVTSPGFPTSVASADFNGDGNLDVFYEVSPAEFFISYGDGAGAFPAMLPFSVTNDSSDFRHVFITDVDEDSFPDVVIASNGTPVSDDLIILVNDGTGTGFSQHVENLGAKSRPHSVAAGDFNEDGNVDLAVTMGRPTGDNANLAILLGDGAGDFGFLGFVDHGGQLADFSIPLMDIVSGDLDGDSNLDLVVANTASNTFAVMLGNGDGSFDAPAVATTGGNEPLAMVLRDLNGDLKLDVAFLNRNSNNVGVRLGAGDGSFGAVSTYGLGGGTGSTDLLAADIDFDGKVDLVTVNQGTGNFSVLRGTGGGTFAAGLTFASGNAPWAAATGDFNEDTRPDLAVARGTFGGPSAISVFPNTTDEVPPNTIIDTQPPAITNSTTANFTFHGTDPAPSSLPLTFECSRDDVNAGAWEPCDSGSFDNGTASEGKRKFEVRAIDGAGNVDPTPAKYEWNVDLTKPTITVTTPKVGPPHDHFELHTGSPSFTCSDDPPAGSPPYSSGIDTCTRTGFNNDIPLGSRLVTFNATDKAGNQAVPVTRAYVIDPPNYGDFVRADNPRAYYRFEEPYPNGSSPQEIPMQDSSGNGHHGTYKNDVALRRQPAISCERRPHPPRNCDFFANDPDRPGWAAFFPERDGYGYVNGISRGPGAYTMEAWVKPRTAGPMMVMSQGRAGQLFIDGTQRLAFEQSQDTVSSPGPNIPVGDWTHVAATWDGNNTRLYVNGVQVAHSTTANKPPSGTSTLYVGYGEKAPWFHGEIDEAALYDRALGAHAFQDRNAIGRAINEPSPAGHEGNDPLNTGLPHADPTEPKNNGLYAPGKLPPADFASDCHDADGDDDVASCTATVDGNPIAQGGALPQGLGLHDFVVTVRDDAGNEYVHKHTYDVVPFSSLYGRDPLVAYYRVGDGQHEHMKDSSPHGRHGEYKNETDQGPVGIAGDGDHARDFKGPNGYGYANGLPSPNYQMSLEAWVEPDSLHRDQSIAGHGDGGEIYLEGGVFKFRHGPQNRVVSSSPPYAPNPNSTYSQVLATWDGVDLRIYVNGQLEGTTESSRRPSSSSTFYVGFGEIKPWFDGRIDEVAYYSTALTPARVLQHFMADPAADRDAGGTGGTGGSGGSGGAGGGTGGGGGGGSTSGAGTGDGGAGDGTADDGREPLRLGDEVTLARRTAMVPLYGGDEPSEGTVSLDAGKNHLGETTFELGAREDDFAEIKLSKKGRRLLANRRFVIATVDSGSGAAPEQRLKVAKP